MYIYEGGKIPSVPFSILNTCELRVDLHTTERGLLHKGENAWYDEKHFRSEYPVSILGGESTNFHDALKNAVYDAEDSVTRMIMYGFPSYVRPGKNKYM